MTTAVRPSPVRLLVTLVTALLAFGAWASPAAAHDGEAVVTVEQAHPEGLGVHYVVLVTWADDGHPATDATVTATAVSPDGAQLTPVTLNAVDGEGHYAGVVQYPNPGAWTLRVTSIEPTGAAEQAQDVAAVAPTPPPDEGGEVTGEAEGGFAPADDDAGDAAADEGGSDDDEMPVYLIVAALAVVVIGAVTAVNIIRRNRPAGGGGPAAGPSETGDDDGPTGDDDTADAGDEAVDATLAPSEKAAAGAEATTDQPAGETPSPSERAGAGAAGDEPSTGPPASDA
jgi:hypothetical protein